jgi:osmotically-inducible protein OsmY
MLSGVHAIAQNSPAPDNTKVNKSDRAAGALAADQAKNNKSDREVMKEIRKSIVDDKSLSSYAHNVKVIAQNGQVTLKGPVHSEEERKSIESKATEVAGAGNVTNQITVKEEKSK